MMRIKNTKRHSAKLLLAALLLVVSIAMPLIGPEKAYALDTDKLSVAEQQDRTQVWAILRCFSVHGGLEGEVSGDDINSQAVWGNDNDTEIPIGYEIDPSNGQRQCQDLDYDALSFVGMSWDAFRKVAYGVNPDGNGNYHLLPGTSQSLRTTIANRLKAKEYDAHNVVGPQEKKRRVLIALSQCIQTIPDGKAATNPTVDKPGYEKYQFRDGKSGSSSIPVGMDLTFSTDQDDDGKYTCDTLINLAKGYIGDLGDKTLEQTTGNTTGDNTGSGSDLGCDGTSNPLTWILCPVINDVLVPAIAATDNLITEQMNIDTNQIFCSNDPTCQDYYTAWSSFRNIALGLLVVAGLIVVICQAVGIEILDAYTIRKVLPRILIASIAITLSWSLMNFAVTLSNDLGFGVRNIIVAPFNNLHDDINIDLGGASDAVNNAANSVPLIGHFFPSIGGDAAVGAAVVGGAVTIWTAFGGIGVMLSYVATAGLAVLIAILVLILRQIVIIMLILLSPVALVAYVLPNTQRIFRMWWEVFSRALLMFPLIAAFIAAGRVFSAISISANGGNDIINNIVGFIAYFGPYFLIPLTFQMSGAIMGGLGNFIQQRAQGGFSALSGYRNNTMKQRVQRARTEGLYRPGFGKFKLRPGGKQRSVGSSLNRIGFWGLNADEMIPMKLGTTKLGYALPGNKAGIPGFRRGGHALEAEIKRAKRDQTVQGAQDLDIGYKSGRLMGGQFQYSYGALDSEHQAMLDNEFGIKDKETGKITGWRAPDNWGERMRVADIVNEGARAQTQKQGFEGYAQTEAQEAAGELQATASEFEKYTKSPETNRVDGRLLGMLSAAKAGRLELSDVVNNHNMHLEAGDQETAQRETALLQDALTGKRVSAARGHSIWYDGEGKAHSSYEDPTSEKAQNSLMRIQSQEIAGSKSEDIDALEETLVAGAAPFKTVLGADGKVAPQVNADGSWQRKDPNSKEGMRAKEVQNRIKTLAQYNYGDSDVGVKIKNIWVNRLGFNADDLEWGKSAATAEDRARAEAGAAPPPEEPH